jgi:geranylgeranyl diphosphate synthase type I
MLGYLDIMLRNTIEHEIEAPADPFVEHVVLLDGRGRPRGTAAKATVHDGATPLHAAFSCYVVDADDRVLLTRRAASKRTWPGAWTNACCGHPQLGESLADAVRRRLRDELGVEAGRIEVAIPDFAYRAVMDDGTVEHELCPVVVAELVGDLTPDPDEVDAVSWVPWDELRHRARHEPSSLSPWSADQIGRLDALPGSPWTWLVEPRWSSAGGSLLATPLEAIPEPDGSLALLPVLRPVERTLRTFLDERVAELAGIDPRLDDLADGITGLLAAGGKRLRPAFVLWGHLAAEGERDDLAIGAGAAIELLHTFALIHDDVMDRSVVRRGLPAAHVSLAVDGARDPAWFGTSAAILAGDLAHVWANELFDGLPIPEELAARARRRYSMLQTEVIAGQYLDLRLAEAHDPVDDDAVRVALLKTARYSVTRPLQLGAALAGGDDDLDERLATYGDAVGLVFQLRDDVLGLFGDPAATGKGCLDDLREGKQTLLAIRALVLADPDDRAVLRAGLGDRDLDEEGGARCRAIVARSGALASVEARIAAEHARAIAAVAGLPSRPAAALTALADLAAFRSR